jgi:hypothetical protein
MDAHPYDLQLTLFTVVADEGTDFCSSDIETGYDFMVFDHFLIPSLY